MESVKFTKTRGFLLGLIILLPLLIGLFQPMNADDYAYQERVSSQGFGGFFNDFYQNTGGRILNIVVMYLNGLSHGSFLLMGVLNGLVLVASVYALGCIVTRHRLRLSELQDSLVFILLFYLIWFGLPDLGSAVFWHSGSASYLLPGFFEILFFTAFLGPIKADDQPKALGFFRNLGQALAVFIFGLVAASSAEQVLVSGIFGIAASVFWLAKKGRFLLRTHLVGIIGFILGAIVLLSAPGNYVRLGHVNAQVGILASMANGLAHFVLYLANYLYAAFLGFVICLYYWRDKSSLLVKPWQFDRVIGIILLLIACASMFIFGLVWAVSPRTFYYFVAFSAAAFVSVLLSLEKRRQSTGTGLSQSKMAAISGILAVLLLANMGNGLYSNIVLAAEMTEREKFIQSEIAKGNMDITITGPYIVDSRISAYTSIGPQKFTVNGGATVNLIEPNNKNYPEVIRSIKQNIGSYLTGNYLPGK